MTAKFESGVFARGVPAWHGLGVVLPDEGLTSEAALAASGLAGWDLTKEPLYLAGGYQLLNHMGVVRKTDNTVLGVVGTKYRIVHNEEAFAWADALVGGPGYHFESAGSLRHGSIVWVLVRTPFTMDLPDSEVQQYLLLWNRHDGTGAVMVQATNVRAVCQNTLRLASATAAATVKIRHTESAESRLAEAQRVMGLSQGAADRAEALARELLDKALSERSWNQLLSKINPIPTDAGRARELAIVRSEAIDELYHNHPTQQGIVGTAWGAYNAFALWTDHGQLSHATKVADADENRMLRILGSQTASQKALELLTK